ncbi:MAG: NUMOD1 domain-containing DNA-binding protein [Bacteroidota bacterium]|nr:NUMOD1 domain-containing DNA-binding protein [Bacteroidota bacterium]
MAAIKKQYPYQNTSLKNIKGERWEDIPGLGGYFMVSNYGRIKRLEYETQYRNGAIHVKPEQITKPRIYKAPNKYKKDYSSFLCVKVVLNKRIYGFTIGRLVYDCFVNHFNTNDRGWYVICVDTDNFKIRPSNLKLVSVSEKSLRSIQRGRFRSPFLDFSEEFLASQYKKTGERESKQVTQYTRGGEKIMTFPSMVAAGEATGADPRTISRAASGKGFSAAGFIWRWGNASSVDMKKILENRRKKHRLQFGHPVTQYDLTGKRVASYPSMTDAGEAVGVQGNMILRAAKGDYKSIKGFVWKKGRGKSFIDLSNYKWGFVSSAASNCKKVKQYSPTGQYLRTHNSVTAAASYIGVGISALSEACRESRRICKGYKWRFVK